MKISMDVVAKGDHLLFKFPKAVWMYLMRVRPKLLGFSFGESCEPTMAHVKINEKTGTIDVETVGPATIGKRKKKKKTQNTDTDGVVYADDDEDVIFTKLTDDSIRQVIRDLLEN